MMEEETDKYTRRKIRAMKTLQRAPTRRADKMFHGLHSERHLIRRAYERYGLRLTPYDLKVITKLTNEAKIIVATDNQGRRICKVPYKGKVLWVFHLTWRNQITTFLPPGCRSIKGP